MRIVLGSPGLAGRSNKPWAQGADVKPGAPAGAINSGFFPKKPDWPAQYPSIVIAVDDIKSAMQLVGEAGGRVLGEPMHIASVGQYVAFFDTEGNRASMLQPDRT